MVNLPESRLPKSLITHTLCLFALLSGSLLTHVLLFAIVLVMGEASVLLRQSLISNLEQQIGH